MAACAVISMPSEIPPPARRALSLQFPFYAGIMGMMVVQNDQGVSLAQIIADAFVAISTNMTFPMLTFLSAGIVNFFVPSGGGSGPFRLLP